MRPLKSITLSTIPQVLGLSVNLHTNFRKNYIQNSFLWYRIIHTNVWFNTIESYSVCSFFWNLCEDWPKAPKFVDSYLTYASPRILGDAYLHAFHFRFFWHVFFGTTVIWFVSYPRKFKPGKAENTRTVAMSPRAVRERLVGARGLGAGFGEMGPSFWCV